jgi:hypothetical protein
LTLDAYIQLLISADDRISHKNARLLTEAIDDLRDYAQQIGHRRSGLMDDSMVRYGPFSVGSGILEAHFVSGAWYAEEEVSRGGSHDWAGRTIAENDARILQLQLEAEQALVTALTGAA